MRLFLTIVFVSIAAWLMINHQIVTEEWNLQVHQNEFINRLANYQLFLLAIGFFTMSLFLLLYPSAKEFLRIGDLSTIAIREKWLGINGRSTWLKNGAQLLFTISIATGIFMFLGVHYTNSLHNIQGWFFPFVLLFSFTNAFSEEMVFRFGMIAGLNNHYSKLTIMIVSAILFGLPHYYGNPGGGVGILMSGVLGYILCKASLETRGLLIAWLIHFVHCYSSHEC
jgi:hypothetical protein